MTAGATLSAAVGARRDHSFPASPVTFLTIFLALVVLDFALLPYVLQERATDWAAYDYASRLLAARTDPYAWASQADIRGFTPYPYLYPPPLAWLWGLGLSAPLWFVVKGASLATLGLFARRFAARPASQALAAILLIGMGAAFPAVIHDLLLGNVMVLFLSAIAVLGAFPDRRWSVIPLGVLIAIAFKPFVITMLIWLLVKERARFVDLMLVAIGLTIAFAVVIGPPSYLGYLAALPKLGGLAQPFSGNLGLVSISAPLALAAIPVAILWSAAGARWFPREVGLAIAIGLSLIVQPTLGFNYASVLIPAVVLIWLANRPIGLLLAVGVLIAAPISPPAAGLLVAVGGSVVGRAQSSGRDAPDLVVGVRS